MSEQKDMPFWNWIQNQPYFADYFRWSKMPGVKRDINKLYSELKAKYKYEYSDAYIRDLCLAQEYKSVYQRKNTKAGWYKPVKYTGPKPEQPQPQPQPQPTVQLDHLGRPYGENVMQPFMDKVNPQMQQAAIESVVQEPQQPPQKPILPEQEAESSIAKDVITRWGKGGFRPNEHAAVQSLITSQVLPWLKSQGLSPNSKLTPEQKINLQKFLGTLGVSKKLGGKSVSGISVDKEGAATVNSNTDTLYGGKVNTESGTNASTAANTNANSDTKQNTGVKQNAGTKKSSKTPGAPEGTESTEDTGKYTKEFVKWFNSEPRLYRQLVGQFRGKGLSKDAASKKTKALMKEMYNLGEDANKNSLRMMERRYGLADISGSLRSDWGVGSSIRGSWATKPRSK